MRREAHDLNEVLAEQTFNLRMLKEAFSKVGATKNEIPSI